MNSSTGRKFQEKEFRQRFIVSVIALAVILALTVLTLTQISSNGTAHAFLDIREAAEVSDIRMVSLIEDTFRSMESLAAFLRTDNSAGGLKAAGEKIAGTAIGPLKMEIRLYYPDGSAVTGAGAIEDVSAYVDYAVTLNGMQNSRYISCTKEDYITGAPVIEFFSPVKKGGRTVALISSILDLSTLPDYMVSPSFSGECDVLFLDARDGIFFVDSYHGSMSDIGEYTGRKDKDGNSVIPFFEDMLSRRETYTTLRSQSTGEVLYIYAVPSRIDGWCSVIVIDEQIAFGESISAGRLLYILTAAEVLICLLYIIWMYGSAKRQALIGSRDLLNRMAGEDGLFLIDCVKDTRKTIHDHCAGADNYSDADSYSESIGRYVNNCVAESDRKMMREITSTDYMLKKLKADKEYTVEYRDISTGIQRFYKMRVVKYSDTEVLQSFAEKDREIFDRLIFKKLEAEYFALFTVDVDAGLIQVLKKGPWQGAGEIGQVEPYTPAVRKLADTFEGETRDFFVRFSDILYLKQRFEKEDKASHIYPTHISTLSKWGNVTALVLARRKEGAPSLIALCFKLLDGDMVEKVDLQLKLEASMHVVGGLASEYTALYQVDLGTGAYTPYQSTAVNEEGRPFFENIGTFKQLLDAYADSGLVHPEHRDGLREFYSSDAAVRDALRNKKKISYLFLGRYGDEYLWTEADIIKCEDIQDEAHSVIVGLIEKDAEVKRDLEVQRRKKEEAESKNLADNITSRYNIVYIVDLARDSIEIRRMDDSMLEKQGRFTSFTEAKEFTLSQVIHPRDRERMRHELDFDTIRQKLAQTPSYDTTYSIIKNNATMWGKMKITAIGEDKMIFAMSEKDIEIPKHIMEEMRYEEYFALYFVDIDTGMMREVRNVSGFTSLVGEAAAPYSENMRAYAATLEGETRDYFMRIADLAYIRRDFASDSKRTFAFKSRLTANWVEAVSYVLERHTDGSPAVFSLGFIYVDSLSAERQEFQTQIRTDMQMIDCLASGYKALYFADLDAKLLKVYSYKGHKIPEEKRIVSEGRDPFDELYAYGRSDRVHPEDRRLFEELNTETLREKLAHAKSFSMLYRHRTEQGYGLAEMVAVKNEDINERANALAVGFAEPDAVSKTE